VLKGQLQQALDWREQLGTFLKCFIDKNLDKLFKFEKSFPQDGIEEIKDDIKDNDASINK